MGLFDIAFVSSFSRRRESNFGLGQLLKKSWVPACVGMTIAMFVQINVSFAQDTLPAIGSAATDQTAPADTTAVEDVKRILVVGDEMGGGMGGGLTRMTANDPTFEVVNRFSEASALARPDRYDWAASIPKIMEGKDFSAAVVLIGLNDRQDIRTSAGSSAFNSPEWIAAYKANVDALIDALLAQNVKVIWLGQPPMGDAAYDADMQMIAALQKERALAKGVKFVDLRTPFLGPDGLYSARGPDDSGVDQKLRQNDGVTFFRLGNNRIGQIVLQALKEDPTVPPVETVTVAPGKEDAPAPTEPDEPGPVFAQEDQNGQAILHSGGDVIALVANENANAAAISASSIGIAASAGSAAEKMFTVGISPAAPAGRFDDFTYTPPAP
jgi:uncharacterized protein